MAAFPWWSCSGGALPVLLGIPVAFMVGNLALIIDEAWVRDFLGRYVEARSRRLEALKPFEAVARGGHSSSGEAWSRAALVARV